MKAPWVGSATGQMQRALSGLRSRRLAVSIQGSSLRLLLAEGRRVLAWAQVPFNPALLRGGFVSDTQGVANVIRNALATKGIGPAPVLAAFPAFQSIVRILRLPRGHDVHPGEVVPREARRLMAFSPNEQYLFWRRVGATEAGQSFLAVAVPKAPLKAFLESLRQAGVMPGHVELAPLSLIKGLAQGQGVVANIEADSIDICLVANSLPALVRSLWLGDEPLTTDTAANRLAEELVNTINFYNDANPESRIAPEVSIYVAEGFPAENLAPAVASATGHPVLPLLPPLVAPDGFPAAAMAVPAGLVAWR